MDERTQKARETTLTRELLLNERTIQSEAYGEIVLHRPTPRMEHNIGEIRRARYSEDLNDEKILSRAELERLAIRRGMWSKEDSNRIQVLQNRLGQIMGLLDTVGYMTTEEVLQKFNEALKKLEDMFEDHAEKDRIIDSLYRYYNLDNASQSVEDYNVVFKNAPNSSVEDLLSKANLYRSQIRLLEEKAIAQKELEPLIIDQARLFKDSIEERSNRVETLAKIFYCVTRSDGSRLWESFDKIMDEKPRDLELLMEDVYFFERGIPDEDRKILSRHGFTMRAPIQDSSEDSQGSPLSNSDGESPQNEPISSGNSTELVTSS